MKTERGRDGEQAVRDLGLHQVTAIATPPVELVEIAAEARCAGICVFTHAPLVPQSDPPRLMFPVVDHANVTEFKARLVDCGVTVWNAEYFPIVPGFPITDYTPALALAADIGARQIVTHVFETDRAEAEDALGGLTAHAATFGLRTALEFTGLSPGCASLDQAVSLTKAVAAPTLGIGIDVLHLVRTGGTAADVAALDPRHIAYAQLCDGTHLNVTTEYRAEALDRLVPGDGVFDLAAFVEALPQSVAIDVEVPTQSWQDAGHSASQHCREAVEAARIIT